MPLPILGHGFSYYSQMVSGVQYAFAELDYTSMTRLQMIEALNDLETKFNTYALLYKDFDNVVALYYVPKYFFDTVNDLSSPESDWNVKYLDVNIPTPTRLGYVGNLYSPRNKKLLTSPYIGVTVEADNNSESFMFERFTHVTVGTGDNAVDCVRFRLWGGATTFPEIVCRPMGYNGYNVNLSVSNANSENPTYSVKLGNFPKVSFPIQSFVAWLANGGAVELTAMVAGAVATHAGLVASGAGVMNQFDRTLRAGYVTEASITERLARQDALKASDASNTIGTAASVFDALREMTKGTRVGGSQGGSIDVMTRKKSFYFKTMSIHPEFAKKIDDYFDRFGYASNSLKVPYRHARSVYTYTKTKECTIAGGCPADDARKIAEIFNKGITFWANPYAVGVYKSAAGVPVDNIPLGANAT